MQLEHVILFEKIAREKSISKVASASHISQPALSQQMQRLEEEVGLKLFERSNRGIELTQAGRIMQKYAHQFISTYNQFVEEISNFQNNSGTFRIAATSVAGNYAIPCTLFKLKNEFPRFTFSLSSMPSSEVVRQIMEDRADIGFIVGEVEEPGVICKKSFSDKICLVAASDYNVKESLSLPELKRYPLIMLNEKFSSYRLLVDQIKSLGYGIENFNVLYHLDSTESVKASVIGKYGMAFLP
jgi:DNA-binding transcriptional LysR family regulator